MARSMELKVHRQGSDYIVELLNEDGTRGAVIPLSPEEFDDVLSSWASVAANGYASHERGPKGRGKLIDTLTGMVLRLLDRRAVGGVVR